MFNNFRQRQRVHDRLQRVLRAVWASDNFQELIVISHSQGTIIATEFAKALEDTAKAQDKAAKELK